MRILYHHRTRSTDAQRIHIREIVQAFRALGHEVEVAGLVDPETGSDDARRDAGVPLWKRFFGKIPAGTDLLQIGYNLAGIPLLAAKLLRRRPDFIYERYALHNFAGVVAARLFRIPIILEVNSASALELSRDGVIQSYALAAWAERTVCNMATHVIAVSTPLGRILTGLGVRPEKIVVMPNGVNLDHFHPSEADAARIRQQHHLEGRTVIGFIGWFRDWHRLDLLLAAFERVHREHPRTALLLIGDGPPMTQLREYAESHGLAGSVVFAGPIPHKDVPPYLSVIDVAVQPAANEFCCPMKILEYMSLGKPIVGPRQENIEELVEDGVTGCLFTPDSLESMAGALARTTSNPETVRAMGRRCVQTLHDRELFWSGNVRKVLELIGRNSGAGRGKPVTLAEFPQPPAGK
jgi:glycosyltransferase involved in cell wall biosynthesis